MIAVVGAAVLVTHVRRDGDVAVETEPVEPSPIEIATAYLGAAGDFDADRAITYLSDEALAEGWGSPDQFRLELAFYAAQRQKLILHACEELRVSAAGDVVRCPVDYHYFGSDELGLGPFGDAYWDITVRDGTIVSAELELPFMTNGFNDEAWAPFARWVHENHPDDVAVMYTDASQTEGQITEESIERWDRRIDEYVAEGTAKLESATALMDAWVAGDGDAAAALFAPDGTWESLDSAMLPDLHDWYRAVGGEFHDEGCAFRPVDLNIQCDYTYDNDLTGDLGGEPVENAFIVTVDDGAIANVNDRPNDRAEEVWQSFLDWVRINHPDDVEHMYTTDAGLPLLDTGSIALWEQHVDEFVASS